MRGLAKSQQAREWHTKAPTFLTSPSRSAHCSVPCQHTRQLYLQAAPVRPCRVVAHAITTQKATTTASQVPPPEEKVQVDSENVYPLAPSVSVVRGTCSCKLRMEVEYMLKHGTSDNCYLVNVPGALALVDVPYEAYADKFIAALQGSINFADITHIVITHMDPKSIPTLELLLSTLAKVGGPPRKLIMSNPALRLLQTTTGDQPEKVALLETVVLKAARPNQIVQLGTDPANVLQLELTPTPRWPDLMVAYYPPSKVLFSSKLFSAHVYPPEGVVEDKGGWEAYGEDWKYFFECMLAPTARQTLAALDKLDILPVMSSQGRTAAKGNKLKQELAWLRVLLLGRSSPPAPSEPATSGAPVSLQVSTLAPMHGPAVRMALTQLLREYRRWLGEHIKAADQACVAVLYASAYGNTAALAQAISHGITRSGVGVNTLNLEVASLEEVSAAIKQADGFVVGSPTLGGHLPTQVSVALGAILREAKAKGLPCGVFGSFGWSGEGVDIMEGRLKDAGFKFSFPAIRVKFKPTSKDLLQCEASGRDLGAAVKKRARQKEVVQAPGVRAQAIASTTQLAAGRLVGSICVLTAKEDDARASLLASWVSQASFDPPGITVAIKKDRAIEPLLQVNNEFVLNLIPEGAAVLKDVSHAYLECKVASRMEAGDHYVVYANVLAGEVLDETTVTAVHHRKVANHY